MGGYLTTSALSSFTMNSKSSTLLRKVWMVSSWLANFISTGLEPETAPSNATVEQKKPLWHLLRKMMQSATKMMKLVRESTNKK